MQVSARHHPDKLKGLKRDALLKQLQDIEALAGRTRHVRWGPRPIDLDIVLFDHHVVHDPDLHVPHPELPNRAFWQRELAELRGLE